MENGNSSSGMLIANIPPRRHPRRLPGLGLVQKTEPPRLSLREKLLAEAAGDAEAEE